MHYTDSDCEIIFDSSEGRIEHWHFSYSGFDAPFYFLSYKNYNVSLCYKEDLIYLNIKSINEFNIHQYYTIKTNINLIDWMDKNIFNKHKFLYQVNRLLKLVVIM